MIPIAPKTVERVVLDALEANLLWNWLLARQGLSKETKCATSLEVATVSLGLHAARLPSPFVTVLARASAASAASELLGPTRRSELITIRCMRKTLHVLPLRMAGAAHAATLHFRERDALRAIENNKISCRDIGRIIDDVVRLLDQSGHLFHRHIEDRLRRPQRTNLAIRLAVKLAWESGLLVYLNESTGWNREDRQFGLLSNLYPHLDVKMERSSATAALIEMYFDRYGPASIRDAMWWSGLSRSAIVRGLESSGREVVEILTSWTDSPLYMFCDRLDEFHNKDRRDRDNYGMSLNFLAHEDVALKAYFESRNRYLDGIPVRAAFNQIGEALPTILLGGRVIGTWCWDQKTKRTLWTALPNRLPTALRRHVIERADALAADLFRGYTSRPTSNTLSFNFG